MYMNITGSNDECDENPIVGSMHFYQNGEVGISLIEDDDKVSFTEMSTLVFTTEFLMHAVEREDWVLEYMKFINNSLQKISDNEKKKRFIVLDGGIKDHEDIDDQNA